MEAILKDAGQDFKRYIAGYVADNMDLPFTDGIFDSYIANLSLFAVPDKQKMVNESFRVLKPEGKAVFITWGRTENMSYFNASLSVLKKYGLYEGDMRHGEDPEYARKLMTEAGYTDIKTWYQPMNMAIGDGEIFFNTFIDNPTFRE